MQWMPRVGPNCEEKVFVPPSMFVECINSRLRAAVGCLVPLERRAFTCRSTFTTRGTTNSYTRDRSYVAIWELLYRYAAIAILFAGRFRAAAAGDHVCARSPLLTGTRNNRPNAPHLRKCRLRTPRIQSLVLLAAGSSAARRRTTCAANASASTRRPPSQLRQPRPHHRRLRQLSSRRQPWSRHLWRAARHLRQQSRQQ